MNKGFFVYWSISYSFINCIWFLYWKWFFQLVFPYGYMIIVLGYSFNGLPYSQLQLAYQSIYFSISNCSIAIDSKSIQLLVVCYMSIEQLAIAIRIQLAIAISLRVDRSHAIEHQGQSPPATIFLLKSILKHPI